MLITKTPHPQLAIKDISCFKVMVKEERDYLVCPPALQFYIINKFPVKRFKLNTLYETESNDLLKDYRKDGKIGEGFFHTFCKKESAEYFIRFLQDRINNPNTTKHPEWYKLPIGTKLIILNAVIPKGSLYYKGNYKEISSKPSYASNKIIYLSEIE